MDIPPCIALEEKEHWRTSRNNCNAADTRPDEEIPVMCGPDILLVLLKLTKTAKHSNASEKFDNIVLQDTVYYRLSSNDNT